MLCRRRGSLIIPQHLVNIVYYSDVKRLSPQAAVTPGYLARMLNIHNKKSSEILEKHKQLLTLTRKDVLNSVEILKSFNYKLEEIASKPLIIYANTLTLENRHEILKECGIHQIPLPMLLKYLRVMNKEVVMLKAHGMVPFKADVQESLRSSFKDIDLELRKTCSENVPLKLMRENVLNAYFEQKLEMNSTALQKLWKVYPRVRHKSFKSVEKMVAILRKDLNFSNERIVKNGYLLHGDADNVQKMLNEIKTIGDEDFKEILYKRPKIMMSLTDGLLTTIDHVKLFNISETAITRCLEVLTLGPDTVLERLKDLNEIEEFKVLVTNPRVLRLVHYQNKARLRLDYLNQLKVRCASLHILSCGSDAFAKFARDGSDRTKGRDIIVFLANIMQKDESDIRSFLSRHPNWCHIPLVQVKQCYEFLQKRKFTADEIFHNIHVLLYPMKRIEEKILQVMSDELCRDLLFRTPNALITNREVLTLVLYLIECEFHFTGDGVWTEQHTQPVENFNNLLPDFPENYQKIYKFGTKPAGSSRSSEDTKLFGA